MRTLLVTVVMVVVGCLEPAEEGDGGSIGGGSVGGGSVGGGSIGGGSTGGGTGAGPSCFNMPEPATIGGCLPNRGECAQVAGTYTLSRGVVDAGCMIRWRDPLRLDVSLGTTCSTPGQIRWVADGGCGFVAEATHSDRYLVAGQCFAVFHVIRVTAAEHDGGALSFSAVTSGYGEGNSCPAVFSLQAAP